MEDIHTLDEALEDPEWDYDEFDPDYTRAMAEDAIQTGEIRVYSSYPITEGVFVTPSEMEAESYSADGRKILYDIGPIKKVGQSVKSDTSLLSAGQRGNSRTSTAESSVAEKPPSVKGQYSLTQATEGRKMSSRARRDVNQTMNAVRIAGDKKPESALRSLVRGTPEGTRTPNPQNRNLMLYPLSHWRVCLYIITHDAEKSSGGREKLRGGKPVPLQREMAAVTGKNPRPQTFENQAQRAAAGRA